MDLYKTLFDQEEVLKNYTQSIEFNSGIKVLVKTLKSFNLSYDEIVLRAMEEFHISKWWAEEKVQEFWNQE